MVELTRKTNRNALAAAENAIKRSQEYILSVQWPEGYWWGELESNPTMEAEYLMLTYFLEVEDKERWRKLANHIRSRQRTTALGASTTRRPATYQPPSSATLP